MSRIVAPVMSQVLLGIMVSKTSILISRLTSLVVEPLAQARHIIVQTDQSHEVTSYLTSPPSAREAAMSAMQYETFLKHLESFLKLP